MGYQIASRDEALINAWFDEVLPHTFVDGRPGIDDFKYVWPAICVYPMWAWDSSNGDPDWPADSRVTSRYHEFQARDGEEGMRALSQLKARLEKEVADANGD